MEKSSIFMAGVAIIQRNYLLAKTRLSLGSFPFKVFWFAIVSKEMEHAGMSPID